MTIEEKAKEFDASLERAKKLIETCDSTPVIGWCEYIFPMLKESEWERIRKEIIAFLKENHETGRADETWSLSGIERWIAWLEKQGQSKKTSIWKHWKDGITGNGDGIPVFLIKNGRQDITALGRCAVEHEQKPSDKIEPKFHEGDWLVDNNDCDFFKVIKVRDNTYRIVSQEGEEFDVKRIVVEHDYHKFTINDAKKGDVLVDVYGNIGIYEKCYDFDWMSYCSLGYNGGFQHFKIEHENEKTHPATKEQCKVLFSKMKEEGWFWNPETKKLSQLEVTKKSEGWSEEDEVMCQETIDWFEQKCFPYASEEENPAKRSIQWLKSLKQRLT